MIHKERAEALIIQTCEELCEKLGGTRMVVTIIVEDIGNKKEGNGLHFVTNLHSDKQIQSAYLHEVAKKILT